ncbi:FG-GAP repeat domain-containing protein [Nonomuraea sp. NPDC051941]|uniref:FG-GAP repeat domain-containing protein n=1 Tax=Nonomuraea sp. NPDC051941 TaxID=3364373 RepID=UPI0037CAC3DD
MRKSRIGRALSVTAGALAIAAASAMPAQAAPDPGKHRSNAELLLACPSVPAVHDQWVTTAVHRVGRSLNANDKVMLAAFETGWVESHMNNLNCGDKDSLGVFQQRPSQGWGTPEQILDVSFAANSFFTRAIRNDAANPGYTPGQLAQSVQRSAFPDRYDQSEAKARSLLNEAAWMHGMQAGSPADFDGDGKDDIITFAKNASADVYVSTSSGTAFNGTSVKWHDFFGLGGETTYTGDFTGDGKDDVVTFTHGSSGDVYVAPSTGTGFGPAAKWHDFFAPGGEIAAVGDFDGDGKDDIATFARGTTQDVFVALSNGNGFGAGQKWHDFFGLNGEFPAVGDVNGDGKDDIIVFTQGSTNDVYVATSTGTGFNAAVKMHDNFALAGEQPRIADVNGDGKDDIVTFTNNGLGDVWVAISDGQGFGPGVKWNDWFAPNGEFPYTGDFDGDGKDDIVTFTKGTTNDVFVGLSNGTSAFGAGVKWHDFFGLNGETTL